MKPFTLLSISTSLLVALLASCNPTRTIIADDLYYQRPSDLAIGEDPNDPTSYAAFKDRQQANKQAQLFESNKGTSTRSFYRNNTFFNSNFQNKGINGMWGDEFFNPRFNPYFRSSIFLFNSPLGFNNGFNPFNNYGYNHYGYNQWGQYIGYGYGSNFYGNNYYGNSGFNNGYYSYGNSSNYGFSNPNTSSIYTTISGPRGGYNTLTGNRDAGGGAKYRSSSANTAGNNTSTAVRVNASSLARSGSNSIVKNTDRNTTSSPSIKAENRPMGSDGRAIKPKTYESRPVESNRSSTPKLSSPRATETGTGSGSGRSQPSSPTRSTPSKSGGGVSRSGGRG